MMYVKLIFGAFFFATPFFVLGEVVPVEPFSGALLFGSRHANVVLLQKILNSDRETQIADKGAGAPGNETDYFGKATKRALVKFQEKYREEILTPAGLSRGTGFMGEKTRAKLKMLIHKGDFGGVGTLAPIKQSRKEAEKAIFAPNVDGNMPKNTLNDSTVPTITPSVALGNKVFVMLPSQYSGKPGTEISVSGAGFTSKDNIVRLGTHKIVGVSSWSGASLSFKIPEIPKGIYPLFVQNAQGESDKDAFFVVTDGVTPEPSIERIAPDRALLGSNVVVRGSGFNKTSNMVRTSTEVLTGVPSVDGTTLSFRIGAKIFESMTSEERAITKGNRAGFPIWVYVVNENGVSKPGMFTLGL